MKIRTLILSILVASVPFLAKAQGTTNDLETDLGARISAGVDKKLAKGVHLSLDAEARFNDDFSNFGRYQAGLGISYKIDQTFKIGAGYIFIQKKNSSDEWKARHRFYVDGQATFRSDDWRFSIKERLQLTNRSVNNKYQSVPNQAALKSRFKVSYKGLGEITPYGYLEARLVFNDASANATWSTTDLAYTDYEFGGYDGCYFNRFRFCAGMEWKVTKQHSFDFFLLADYCKDKNIDTNSSGTKLKSLTWDQNFNFGIGVGYKFSF